MCAKAALDNIADAVRDAALRIFGEKLNSVILYGSYACGANDAESDIDIMLLLDLPAESLGAYRNEIAKVASRLSLGSAGCVTISVALQDMETFEKYKSVLPFYRNVVAEGVVVYAA